MSSSNYSASGGAISFDATRVRNVQIPETIKCSICQRERTSDQFSNKQLADLRFKAMVGARSKTIGIRCRKCTGAQNLEMHCYLCGHTKELAEFAFAQRKNVDRARCKACMQEVLETKPDERQDPDDSDAFSFDGDSTYDSDGDVTNPYEMTEDGDYETEMDGGARLPSTAHSSTTASQGTGRIFRHDVGSSAAKFKSHEAASVSSDARQAPARSRDTSNVANGTDKWNEFAADKKTDPNYDPNRDLYEDDDDEPGTSGGVPAGGRAPVDNPGPAFNAWGPNGQHAVHHRRPSTAASTSTQGCIAGNVARPPRSGRAAIDEAANKRTNFPRIRPQNQKAPKTETGPFFPEKDAEMNSHW